MRKLIYSMMVSLDGYVEDPNRNIDWILIDEELHQFANDQQAEVDTYLYGRGMYENMAAFWPTADQDPAMPGYIHDFARIWRKMPKIVFSRTLAEVAWNARLVRDDVAGEVEKLKAQPGKPLTVGGAHLAAALARQNLIDEYQLFVNPVVLGNGTPFLPKLDEKINLRMVETRTFTSGVVLLRYLRDVAAKNSDGV